MSSCVQSMYFAPKLDTLSVKRQHRTVCLRLKGCALPVAGLVPRSCRLLHSLLQGLRAGASRLRCVLHQPAGQGNNKGAPTLRSRLQPPNSRGHACRLLSMHSSSVSKGACLVQTCSIHLRNKPCCPDRQRRGRSPLLSVCLLCGWCRGRRRASSGAGRPGRRRACLESLPPRVCLLVHIALLVVPPLVRCGTQSWAC